jgi:hypothetical protein
MDLLRRQDSAPSTPAKSEVNVSVADVHNSDEDKEQKQDYFEAQSVVSTKQTSTSTTQISHVIESGRSIKSRIIYDLEDVDQSFFDRVTLEQFLEFIADERLIHMPRKGSQWDRVLKSAEFFALQLYNFGLAVSPFVHDSENAAFLAIGFCQLLLEVRYAAPFSHFASDLFLAGVPSSASS